METLNWHNAMCDYYWELIMRNAMMGSRIDPYDHNDGLIEHEKLLAAKHRAYSVLRYNRLGLYKE